MIKYQPMEEKPHLYIIPIAHTSADMGAIPFDERYEATVTGYWVGIFRYLKNLSPAFIARLQIYQDGLPNTSEEIVNRIVDETQTANYEILRWLKEKGAVIFGTEDPSFLMEKYEALKATANFPKSSWLLRERDKSIAQRIGETLPGGKTGLLFIGAAHDVGSLLSNEIRVSTPEVLRDFSNLGKERR